jgi:hypothetical protein
VKTERLQLTLIPELQAAAQPLPPEYRAQSVETIARMLLRVVGVGEANDEAVEGHDEPQ